MAVSQIIEVAKARALASGGEVGANVSFSGIEVRVNDGSNMFAEGDEFTIPRGRDLQESKFIRMFNGNKAPGIFVEVAGAAKELYLSAFVKAVVPYNDDSTRVKNEDGTPMNAIVAKGTAVELWKQSANAEDALKSIEGKKCKLSKIESVQTMRTRANGVRSLGNQWVYTIDLV